MRGRPAAILAALGLVAVALGIFLVGHIESHQRDVLRTGVTVPATDLTSGRGRNGVQYSFHYDVDGKRYFGTIRTGSDRRLAQLQVTYDPHDPSYVTIASAQPLGEVLSVILAVAGGGVALLSGATWALRRRARAHPWPAAPHPPAGPLLPLADAPAELFLVKPSWPAVFDLVGPAGTYARLHEAGTTARDELRTADGSWTVEAWHAVGRAVPIADAAGTQVGGMTRNRTGTAVDASVRGRTYSMRYRRRTWTVTVDGAIAATVRSAPGFAEQQAPVVTLGQPRDALAVLLVLHVRRTVTRNR